MTSEPDERADDANDVLELLAVDVDRGFVALIEAHQGLVATLAARACGRSAADAEDLAAESLLRAYRALCGYPPERIAALRLRPWLATIVLNTSRNDRRSAARRPSTTTLSSTTDPRVATDGGWEDQHGEADAIRVLVERLPPRQRTAVVLRHVVGMPTSEVAEAMGCPEGTAKSHASRGIAQLRRLLRPTTDPPTTDAPPTEEGRP